MNVCDTSEEKSPPLNGVTFALSPSRLFFHIIAQTMPQDINSLTLMAYYI